MNEKNENTNTNLTIGLTRVHDRVTLIVSLTPAGKKLAEAIQSHFPGVLHWHQPKPFVCEIQRVFEAGYRIIFICATGIVMRTLAPVIQHKKLDPPVIVLDEGGRYVIPLLSGHEGGANQWALEVARKIKAQAVLTTANAYTHPIYTVGMGCERNCPTAELEELLLQTLEQTQIDVDQVETINSLDLKQDEVGLIELSKQFAKPYRTYKVEALRTMESMLSQKSEYVFNTVGVYGVAESAALYAAKQITNTSPELLVTKQKSRGATCAIARGYYTTEYCEDKDSKNDTEQFKMNEDL